MAKKSTNSRKPSGIAGIAVTEDSADLSQAPEAMTNAAPTTEKKGPALPKNKAKEEPSCGNVGIGEIRKAAAFANSVGGLEKAIALLQILKVAKEVQ